MRRRGGKGEECKARIGPMITGVGPGFREVTGTGLPHPSSQARTPRLIRGGEIQIPFPIRVNPRTGTPQLASRIWIGMPKTRVKIRVEGVVMSGKEKRGIAERGKTRVSIGGDQSRRKGVGERWHVDTWAVEANSNEIVAMNNGY